MSLAARKMLPESATPQPSSDFSMARALHEFEALAAWAVSAESLDMPFDQVERGLIDRSAETLRLLLQANVQARGDGDLGPALVVSGADGSPLVHDDRRDHRRHLQTIYGTIEIDRLGYGAPGRSSIHPLDADLQLPERGSSYEVQRRVIKAAAQGPFDEAIGRLKEGSAASVAKLTAENMIKDAAQDMDEFYKQRTAPPAEETSEILVAAADCKGVPLIKPKVEGGKKRKKIVPLKKGEKLGKKKMATVAAVFTQAPRVRTAEEVVASLFNDQPKDPHAPKPPLSRPEHKRVWASLGKSKETMFEEIKQEIEARDPKKEKIRVALTDGERALQSGFEKALGALGSLILILDLLHVCSKLWEAAYCFHKEGSKEAEEWFRKKLLKILKGQVSSVIQGMLQSATKKGLTGKKREKIDKVAAYFRNNCKRMEYNEYLARGLPIASGSVEGACKNLVKDRMERSGMRWKEDGAEAVLKMRAIYLSGDFDEYWAFHIAQDQKRLRPGKYQTMQDFLQAG